MNEWLFQVLRPYSNMSMLKIWSYYLEEHLSCGPVFDFETFSREAQQQEDQEGSLDQVATSTATPRRVINACYHNSSHALPDAFSYLLAVRGDLSVIDFRL